MLLIFLIGVIAVTLLKVGIDLYHENKIDKANDLAKRTNPTES